MKIWGIKRRNCDCFLQRYAILFGSLLNFFFLFFLGLKNLIFYTFIFRLSLAYSLTVLILVPCFNFPLFPFFPLLFPYFLLRFSFSPWRFPIAFFFLEFFPFFLAVEVQKMISLNLEGLSVWMSGFPFSLTSGLRKNP